METKIELFEEAEASELSRIICETIDEMEKSNPKVDYARCREEDTPEELIKASKNGRTWVVKINGRIVGTIGLTGNRLRRFFVHPKYQRMGIGKKLVETAKEEAKTKGLSELWVGAVLSAVSAYKKMGFNEGKIFFNTEIDQEEMKMRLVL